MDGPDVGTLRSERLVLAPAAPAWAEAVAAFQRENLAHLAPWSPVAPPGFLTARFWAERLAEAERERAEGRSVRLIMALADAPDAVVGTINFTTIVRGVWHCCNLGYQIDEGHVGRGLMTEGLRVAIAHLFDDHRLHRIQANYMPRNERSGKVLRRLGFKVEGYAYDYLQIAGRWEDHVLTSLTNPAWRPPGA